MLCDLFLQIVVCGCKHHNICHSLVYMIAKRTNKKTVNLVRSTSKANNSCFVACNSFDTTVKTYEYEYLHLCSLTKAAETRTGISRAKRTDIYPLKCVTRGKICKI